MASGVITTVHSDDASRCVKIIKEAGGTFGFREYRRDPEDAGGWTLVSDSARATYTSERQAATAARNEVAWLREMAPPSEEPH